MLGSRRTHIFVSATSCLPLFVLALCAALVPAYSATVTGKVVDRTGAPLAGASVWLVNWPTVEKTPPPPVQSGPDGSFSLTTPQTRPEVQPTSAQLVGWKPGLAVNGVDARDLTKPVTLALAPPETLTGKLLGDDGLPLPGAALSPSYLSFEEGAFGIRGYWFPDDLRARLTAKTDAEGQFTLAFAPPEGRTAVRISAPGYGEVTAYDLPALLPLRLRKAGALRVALVCPDPAVSLAGVRLGYQRQSRGDRGPGASGSLLADDHGAFSQLEAPPGAYDLNWYAEPPGPYHFRGERGISVKSGETTTVEMTAEKTAPLTGRLLAADTGLGVAKVDINLSQYDSGYSTHCVTGADGSFSAPCLPGKTTLSLWGGGGYLPTPADSRREVQVTAEGARIGDLRLERALKLVCQVLDAAGRPVSEALVTVRGKEPYPIGVPRPTDEQGRLEVGNLRAGTYTLSADKDPASSGEVQVALTADTAPVRLVLKPGGTCGATLLVVDQDGRPVAGAQLSLWEYYDNGMSRGTSRPDRTDDQGRFAWPRLRADTQYGLVINARAAYPVSIPPWKTRAGEVRDLGPVRLTLMRGSVAGTVVDEAGQPVAKARLWDPHDGPALVETFTDAAGRFRLEGVAEGGLYLFAEATGHGLTGGPAQAGQADAKLTFRAVQPAVMGAPIPSPAAALDPVEARSLALDLLKQALQETNGQRTYGRQSLLTALARLDPDAAMTAAVAAGDNMPSLYLAAGTALLKGHPDQAVPLLKKADPNFALGSLLSRAETNRRSDPDLARLCLETTETLLPTLPDPARRVRCLARMAVVWRGLDDARAAMLLQQATAAAEALPVMGSVAISARGLVAAALAPQDTDAAQALLTPVTAATDADKQALQAAKASLAAVLALQDLPRALKLVEGLSEWEEGPVLQQIALALAPAQPARAQEVVARIRTSYHKSLALVQLVAVVPEAQVPATVEAARDHLLETAQRPSQVMPEGQMGPQGLAALACLARRRGYTAYRELALRAASLDPRTGDVTTSGLGWVSGDLRLAQLLSFTAPEAAQGILQASLRALPSPEQLSPHSFRDLVQATADVDLKAAIQLYLKHRPPQPKPDESAPTYAVASLVDVLTRSPDQRERDTLAGGGSQRSLSAGSFYLELTGE